MCDLFREPARWNGVLVQVSGVIDPGTGGEDGPLLVGKHCDARIVVKGRPFPNLVYLESPLNRRNCLHPVEFEEDYASLRAYRALSRKAEPTRAGIFATIVGLFETRTPLTDLIQEDRPWNRYGFGHLGGSPVQIIVKTMTNMSIVPREP